MPDSIGPNPHVVRMFAAEKGVEIAIKVDIGREKRGDDYKTKSRPGTMPTLERADGACLTEITAICAYREQRHPTRELIGATAAERAETRIWTRRIDLGIAGPKTNGFRASEGRPLFEPRMELSGTLAAAELKQLAADELNGSTPSLPAAPHVYGNRFSLADILLFASLRFGATASLRGPVPAT